MTDTVASSGGEMRRSLTLTGVTVNAMALIAPGAFLWTTFQAQSALQRSGVSTANEMWTGLFFSLILALLTAYSYAELARIYPDAGTGSSYYFAEAALLDKDKPEHHRYAPARQAHRRLDQPSLLLDLPGHHGRVHRDPGRLHLHGGLPRTLIVLLARGQRVSCSPSWSATSPIGGSAGRRGRSSFNVIQIVALVSISVLFIVYRSVTRTTGTSWPTPAGCSSRTTTSTCSTSRPSPSCCWSGSSR